MDENGYIERQWPSKRIAPGGLFHPPKVKYTPETQQLLKVLMEESKLTLMQRRKMDWCLRSGGSLMDLSKRDESERKPKDPIIIRPKTSRRRSYSVIKNSGDLERELYRPTKRSEDREVTKKHLQEMMEYGRNEDELIPKIQVKAEKTPETKQLPTKMDMLHELLTQIQEREEWLREMETLGEGDKHREVIQHQIAERIRRIEALGVKPANELNSVRTSTTNGEGNTNSDAKSKKQKFVNSRRKSHKEHNNESVETLLKENNHESEDSTIKSGQSRSNPDDYNKSKIITPKSNDYAQINNVTLLCKQPNTAEDKTFSKCRLDSSKKPNSNKTGNENSKPIGKESVRGFSLEGSPCIPTERSDRSKSYSSRSKISSQDSKNISK